MTGEGGIQRSPGMILFMPIVTNNTLACPRIYESIFTLDNIFNKTVVFNLECISSEEGNCTGCMFVVIKYAFGRKVDDRDWWVTSCPTSRLSGYKMCQEFKQNSR